MFSNARANCGSTLGYQTFYISRQDSHVHRNRHEKHNSPLMYVNEEKMSMACHRLLNVIVKALIYELRTLLAISHCLSEYLCTYN